jgi:predicted RND superfamily exporter protein
MKKACRWLYQVTSICILKTLRFSLRRSGWVLAFFTAVTLLLFPQMKHLRIILSAQDMVGEGIAGADELVSIRNRFNDGTTSLLWILPPEGRFSFTPAELCDIRRWFAVERVSHPEFKLTTSSFDLKWPVATAEATVKYRNVLDLGCDPPELRRPAEDIKKDLDESPWALFSDKHDRLGLLFVFTYKDALDDKFGSFDPAVLTPLRASLEKELLGRIQGAQAHWVGPADYQWYVHEGMKLASRINLGMLLFLFVMLRVFFGSWKASSLFCLMLVLTMIWIFGAKGFLRSEFDVLSTGLFLMIGIASLEDFVFMSAEQMKGTPWRKSVRLLIIPSFYTSLTTVIGFASLGVSDLAIIRRFGMWAAAGSALEWIMVFIFMPALLQLFMKAKVWVNPLRSFGDKAMTRISVKALPRSVSLASLIVFPLAVIAFFHLDTNETPHALFPKNSEYTRGLDELRESKEWIGSVSLLSDGAQSFAELDDFAKRIQNEPGVRENIVSFESPGKILDWMNKDLLVPEDLTLLRFEGTPIYKQLVDADGFSRALLYVRDTTVHGLLHLKDAAGRVCGENCHLGGELIVYAQFADLVPKTLIESMAVSLLLVGIVILYLTSAFGQQRVAWKLLVSSFWGPLLLILLIVVLDLPMDFMKCMVASILVGLAGDNAIQYLFAARSKDFSVGVKDRGGASILTNLLMAGTALFYLFSYFASPRQFGLLLCTGFVASLVGDLWLLNGLLEPETAHKTSSPGPSRIAAEAADSKDRSADSPLPE